MGPTPGAQTWAMPRLKWPERPASSTQLVTFRDAAFDYLVGWAGHRHREPRPARYAFLRHRWQAAVLAQPRPPPEPRQPQRLVQVCGARGQLLPAAPEPAEEEDDAEPGPLAIMPEA